MSEKRRYITDLEKGYLAGVLDCDGCLAITRHKKESIPRGYYYQARLHIYNNDKSLLKKVVKLFKYGNVLRANKKDRKNGFQVNFGKTSEIKRILEEIRPENFVRKKRQAELLIEFCTIRLNFMRNNRRYRNRLNTPEARREQEIWKEMRKLNKRFKR